MLISKVKAHQAQNLVGGQNTLAQIKGQTKRLNVPYQAFVYLFNPVGGEIKTTLSDQDGFYWFKNLPKGHRYVVFARDPLKEFNAVISDNVVTL